MSYSYSSNVIDYMSFDRYCRINQHIEYHMVIKSIHHSWQMKEQLPGIKNVFIWRTLIKYSSWRTKDPVESLVSTTHIFNQ